jgi:hypothetical protein
VIICVFDKSTSSKAGEPSPSGLGQNAQILKLPIDSDGSAAGGHVGAVKVSISISTSRSWQTRTGGYVRKTQSRLMLQLGIVIVSALVRSATKWDFVDLNEDLDSKFVNW